MDERVLAEGPGRICLGGSGGHASLSITDGLTVRFVVEVAALETVLNDVPVQLSALGNYCRIEAFGDRVRMEFALAGAGRGSCVLPTSEFADALTWVRTRPGRA